TNVLESFINDRIKEKIQKTFYGDRAKMIKTLQAEGITYEALREQERENLIVDYMRYQNTSSKKILISPLKIETYYKEHPSDFKVDDQVKLRMIVIPKSPDASADNARKVAKEIMAKIDGGVPFAEMAGVYTTGSQRAEGGDRGWVDHSYFKPELAAIAFSLKPGQHSGVIELPEACYLMLVEDVRQAHVKTLAEVRSDIERTLKTQETHRLQDQWIDRLKRKTFIQYY
ncbi:MAG TPA: peptidylprolyl isomerase, partial [Humisphaera sp.]|nr:peptidylprolyl isomerase [Humisphaera sp.]